MRGPIRIGLLAVSLVSMFAFTASSALAKPQLWTDSTKTTLLRDGTTLPAHQPDAMEFVNNGKVELEVEIAGVKRTIVCEEIEFGTTVVSNTTTLAKLALPFGVAEGDECKVLGANVPTYFDTLASGAVGNATNGNVASVIATEPKAGELIGTVADLKFSQNVPTLGFCTGDINGLKGEIKNAVGALVEEKIPNLNITFTKVKVPITASGGVGCPTEGLLTANFFLETPSTTTDTAFLG